MDLTAEWLEPDHRGGFASGTVGLERTRRYHALLLVATHPPGGRFVLVNGIEAWVDSASGRTPLSTQRYLPDVVYPDGHTHISGFSRDPWPSWEFTLPDGTRLQHEIFVAHDTTQTVLRWRRLAGTGLCRLQVRPLLSGRDYHALHRENTACSLAGVSGNDRTVWQPYGSVPAIGAFSNGTYVAEPQWYRNFLYTAERDRGLDCVEDLASPGRFEFDLAAQAAVLIFRCRACEADPDDADALADRERRLRGSGPDRLAAAATAYLAEGQHGETILAGFPWFTDWGRDTFIALRGLTLPAGRLASAEAILASWAGRVDQGMLPNRFTEAEGRAEYNTVDASLWFVIAVEEFLRAAGEVGRQVCGEPELARAVNAILAGYTHGTRYRIGVDADGLIRAGEPGVQLTWMDAKIGDRVVTPRVGKPVEVQALWINALRIASRWSERWREAERAARASFAAKFPNPDNGGLFDVVDADHQSGVRDARVRPNQIFAVGGLPYAAIEGPTARGVVDLVERKLLTPLGLRSLAADEPGYAAHYRGGPAERDLAYHQGTVWPWLIGPFVEAWLRVRGATRSARDEARARFLPPLSAHLETAGLGHVSEIADGDPPHAPGGCPFQAWSLGELIRVQQMLGVAPGVVLD